MSILKTVLRTEPWFLLELRLVSPGEPRLRITPQVANEKSVIVTLNIARRLFVHVLH